MASVSLRLTAVEEQLDDRTKNWKKHGEKSKIKEDVTALKEERDRLKKQRSVLDEKLQEGSLLSPREERRLIGLEEGIEALDAAIEFKNDVISSRQKVLKNNALTQSEIHVMSRLHSLSNEDTRGLLVKYFDKVISLKEDERKKMVDLSQMQIKLDEQQRLINELNGALQKSKGETERKLLAKQMEHEQRMQVLLRQAHQEDGTEVSNESKHHEEKIQQLEKDLFYYKKTSRELKKKLREIVSSAADRIGHPEDINKGESHEIGRDSSVSSQGDMQQAHKDDQTSRVFTPVRKSRKEIRELSSEELEVRRSGANSTSGSLADSLMTKGSNPWT